MEPGGGSRGPCRPTDRRPGCVTPPFRAPDRSFWPFLYPSGHTENPRGCPGPKHGRPLPQCRWSRHWNLSPRSPELDVRSWSLRPGPRQAVSLPPQNSPSDLSKAQIAPPCSEWLPSTLTITPWAPRPHLSAPPPSPTEFYGPPG